MQFLSIPNAAIASISACVPKQEEFYSKLHYFLKKRVQISAKVISLLSVNENVVDSDTKLSTLDGIVHCAGFTIPKPFNFLNREDVNSVMDVNFIAPIFLTQFLLKNKKINKKSSIVFISSISGVYVSYIAGSLYSASKGAINGIVKGLAL